MPTDTDQLKEKRICADCVGEAFLKGLVAEGGSGECEYCGETGPSYSLEQMADCVEMCFEQHFTRTYDDRFENNSEDPVVWAIANATEIEEQPATDIQQILADAHAQYGSDYTGEPTPFDDESTYEEKAADDWRWQSEWREFERSLQTESRYFSQSAAAHLTSVFAGIEEMQTATSQPVIVTAGPEAERRHFYRARAFESVPKLEEAMQRPDLQVGAPPPGAALSGRMNARGISVFYEADNRAGSPGQFSGRRRAKSGRSRNRRRASFACADPARSDPWSLCAQCQFVHHTPLEGQRLESARAGKRFGIFTPQPFVFPLNIELDERSSHIIF